MQNDFKKQSIDFAMKFMGLPLNQPFTAEQLKSQYHALAKKYHPDQAGVSPMASQENFEQLQACYELLEANFVEINEILKPNVSKIKRHEHFTPFFEGQVMTRAPFVKKGVQPVNNQNQQSRNTASNLHRTKKPSNINDDEYTGKLYIPRNMYKPIVVVGTLIFIMFVIAALLNIFSKVDLSFLYVFPVVGLFAYLVWIGKINEKNHSEK